jgi:hypothetical protein
MGLGLVVDCGLWVGVCSQRNGGCAGVWMWFAMHAGHFKGTMGQFCGARL